MSDKKIGQEGGGGSCWFIRFPVLLGRREQWQPHQPIPLGEKKFCYGKIRNWQIRNLRKNAPSPKFLFFLDLFPPPFFKKKLPKYSLSTVLLAKFFRQKESFFKKHKIFKFIALHLQNFRIWPLSFKKIRILNLPLYRGSHRDRGYTLYTRYS